MSIFFNFVSVVSEPVLISAFASLVGVPVGTGSSTVKLEICVVITEIKNY